MKQSRERREYREGERERDKAEIERGREINVQKKKERE